MAKLVDLTGNKVRERQRQVRSYGTTTDLSSTTVERGSTHWTDGSNVNIDGLLGVDGTMSVTGTLNGSGDINLSGTTSVTGPLNITGATTIGGSLDVTGPTTLDGILDIGGDTTVTGKLDVTGPMATKGTLSVEGKTTLSSDLNLDGNGKINVGNLQIEPANGGQINFLNGALSSTQGFGMLLNHASNIDLQAPVLNLNVGKIHTSLASKPASELTPIGIDSAGNIYRIA